MIKLTKIEMAYNEDCRRIRDLTATANRIGGSEGCEIMNLVAEIVAFNNSRRSFAAKKGIVLC